MAIQLVADGWAQPVGRLDRPMLAAYGKARAEKRGLWDGGWTLARTGSPESGASPGAAPAPPSP
jgi:endonuclease YncB( thermonuclease family)